ncbi:PREDICTED: double C2-like domain-containing protein gamma [Bison bison bison]|uniref:Double C2-like domain-containing protein gamma n=1 Tax=Bison bison bison TaxID=43346 RepID=A0A6P3GXR2_BISBB|nr:PREDICTED: double C2-like domain-containing protein gamma [Bison bison bison]
MAGRGRVSMQEHMAIDVSPGPIRPIRLISHYFPHFYPTAEPALHPPDPRPPVTPVHSAPQPQLDPEPEGDSDDSSEWGRGGGGSTLGSAHPGRGSRAGRPGFRPGRTMRRGARRGLTQTLTCLGGSSECPRGSPLWGHTETNLISPSFLHPNTGRKSKYKTSVRKKTLNPEFNEEFFYAGQREELAQKTLLVSVWDYDLGTADDFIGGVQLSSRAGGERQQHWCECLGHSDRRLELWHPLDGAPLQLSD